MCIDLSMMFVNQHRKDRDNAENRAEPQTKHSWAGERVQQVKVLAVKPDNLSSSSGIHMVEGQP